MNLFIFIFLFSLSFSQNSILSENIFSVTCHQQVILCLQVSIWPFMWSLLTGVRLGYHSYKWVLTVCRFPWCSISAVTYGLLNERLCFCVCFTNRRSFIVYSRKLKSGFLDEHKSQFDEPEPPSQSPPAVPSSPPAAAPPVAPPAAPPASSMLAATLPKRQDSDEEEEEQDWNGK